MNKSEKKNGAAFYIALCCCVAVIGLVGYIGRYASRDVQNDTAENVSADVMPENTPILLNPTDEPATPMPMKTSAPIRTDTAAAQTSAVIKQEKTSNTPAPPSFLRPCGGKVIKEMSGDELEYNKILGDWRTHNGADISAQAGEEIKAVHSGTVIEVFSGVLGETVIVDCKNGFTVVYACLSETEAVTAGQEINEGDTIARIGGTGSENISEPHLHLELIKDGEHINPRDYIKFDE